LASRPHDLSRERAERWLALRTAEGTSARARNAYRNAAVAFCNWCKETNRLTANPFALLPKANEKADPQRQRRSLDEGELLRLLAVARERPLLDALTVRTGPRKGERYAKVRPEVRERLELLGRERALTYKTMILTGLRKGELESLTVGSLHLDGAAPFAQLATADEKNREGNTVPIRDDLAADLRAWLVDKLARLQAEARRRGESIPARLPADTSVFNVPSALRCILDRDLRLAGIPKRDERGRTIDVHALRHTFGTLLSKGGVAPRTAQTAMRHSDIRLTMGVYTDPKLLDVAGALDALPALPLDAERPAMQQAVGADAGKDLRQSAVAPVVAPHPDFSSHSGSIPVRMAGETTVGTDRPAIAVTSAAVKRKGPLTIAVSDPCESGREDSNLRPPEPHSWAHASPTCQTYSTIMRIFKALRQGT
jgi:integrase